MTDRKPDYFRWYPKDCDTDENVRRMDDRQFGFYMRCINHAWLNGGLPADLNQLARVIGRTPGYVLKIWPAIAPCFEVRGDRLVNQKQEDLREKYFILIGKLSTSGKSGRASQLKTKDEAQAKAWARPRHTNTNTNTKQSASLLGSLGEEAHTQRARVSVVADLTEQPSTRFNEWIQPWPRKVGIDDAARAWLSVVTKKNEAAVFAARDRYLASEEVSRAIVMGPAKWIFQQARDGFNGTWPLKQFAAAANGHAGPPKGLII